MEAAIILIFVFGYLAITLEHNLKIDKLIPALVMMAICWALIALGIDGFCAIYMFYHLKEVSTKLNYR